MSYPGPRSLLLACLAALAPGSGNAAFKDDSAINPLFKRTHWLPSPLSQPVGTLSLGSELAFGATPFLEVGTNLLRDVFLFYNASAKFTLVNEMRFALAGTFEYLNFNLRRIDSSNPDRRFSQWNPGLVGAWQALDTFAVYLGGSVALGLPAWSAGDSLTGGFAPGSVFGLDFAWSYNPVKRQLKVGNVLAWGVNYDLKYGYAGFGWSHHWPGFHVGIHIFPGADRLRFLPLARSSFSFELF